MRCCIYIHESRMCFGWELKLLDSFLHVGRCAARMVVCVCTWHVFYIAELLCMCTYAHVFENCAYMTAPFKEPADESKRYEITQYIAERGDTHWTLAMNRVSHAWLTNDCNTHALLRAHPASHAALQIHGQATVV